VRKSFTVAAALTVMLIHSTSGLTQAKPTPNTPSDNGTQTGQRIGNIISAAVKTAFPEVQAILQIIWPGWPNNNSRKTGNEAQSALTPAKNSADQAQQANIVELTKVAKNLAVARKFVTSCADVEVAISVMRSMLESKPPRATLTPAEILKLQDWWVPASKSLDGLETPALKDDVQSLDDDFLKSTFGAVQLGVEKFSSNITRQLSQGRESALVNSLDKLEPRVSGITALTAILIGDMGSSIVAASTKLGGSRHGGDQEATDDRNSNLALLARLQSFNASK
jgi:hypothetical protein